MEEAMNSPEEVALIKKLLKQCPTGPRIELGVFKGHTLKLMANHSGLTIGVDSFAGMPTPTENDLVKGQHFYPKGKFNISMEYAKKAVPNATLIKGFVPNVLKDINVTEFAFAHVDMDQYESTLQGLHWLWPRMCLGGIICCDDYFVTRNELASGAIHKFGTELGKPPETFLRKAWWVKES